MSKHYRPWKIDQTLLLPPSVHDFVPHNHDGHRVAEERSVPGTVYGAFGSVDAGRDRNAADGGHTASRRSAPPARRGPLSPLLSNILLDDLDKELENRGHVFCWYADDCNIYVATKRAGERVMASVTRFLKERLKLTVNPAWR